MSSNETTRRYLSLNAYLKARFRQKVRKIGVDIGQSCPHRSFDEREKGGCYYCNPESFLPPNARAGDSVNLQISKGIEAATRTHGETGALIYFQSYTSTMEEVEKLRAYFDEALQFPQTIGIAISGRPDTLSTEFLELLEEYASRTYILLEIGLESIHDVSLSLLGRRHNYKAFLDGMDRIAPLGIDTCIHLILNLPGEEIADMRATAAEMARIHAVTGVKLHHFHVVRDTPFARRYQRGEIPVPTEDQVVEAVVEFLPLLRKDQVIHRLVGDTAPGFLIAPQLSPKSSLIRRIEEELEKRNLRQGACEFSVLSETNPNAIMKFSTSSREHHGE